MISKPEFCASFSHLGIKCTAESIIPTQMLPLTQLLCSLLSSSQFPRPVSHALVSLPAGRGEEPSGDSEGGIWGRLGVVPVSISSLLCLPCCTRSPSTQKLSGRWGEVATLETSPVGACCSGGAAGSHQKEGRPATGLALVNKVSMAMRRYHGQKQHGKPRAYFNFTAVVHHPGSQPEAGADAETLEHCLLACSACFLRQPRSTCPVVAPPHWAGLFTAVTN